MRSEGKITTLPTARTDPFDPPDGLGGLRPLTRLVYADGHLGWLALGHAAVRAVLSDPRFSTRPELKHEPLSSGLGQLGADLAQPGMFVHMDPPEHTRYRRLLTGQFTLARMRRLEPRIEKITEEQLDELARHGSPADLVAGFALPVPSLVICELLGVPYAGRERFQRDSAIVMRGASAGEDVMRAYASLYAFLGELVAAKRAAPADDLISDLLATEELTDEELINICLLLLIAGHETTANMIALGAYRLLTEPAQLSALHADPAAAAEELLRYLSIPHIGPIRVALEDVEIEGEVIKAGESVTVSLPAANRDPRKFEHPDRLDLGRGASGQLAFGHGIHQCLGQQLARIELRLVYSALFSRFPGLRLAVSPEDVPLRTDMLVYGVHRLPVAW
ncbi:cytochrome P450 [Nonomuraea diastatica]|uniref:Cytochrome P450 n=1 Tax=Nonomuraea diastatica TaxID=1848329 RepID=A0A4R4WXY3_9ACTN|nr:cytochrome P450 [Nonomuraea diastatica]TDD22676.1 cytochrome P450 [Nonomuraea diastatica]